MKFKKLILATFLLITILSISTASASQDIHNFSNDNVVSESMGDFDLVLDDFEDSEGNESDDFGDLDDFEDSDGDGSDDFGDLDDFEDSDGDGSDDFGDLDDFEDSDVEDNLQGYVNGYATDLDEINETIGVCFYCPENILGKVLINFDEDLGLENIVYEIKESDWNTTIQYYISDLGIDEAGSYGVWLEFSSDDEEMWFAGNDIKITDKTKFRVDSTFSFEMPMFTDVGTQFSLYYPEGSAGKIVYVNVMCYDEIIKNFSVEISDNSCGFINWTFDDLGIYCYAMYSLECIVDGEDMYYDSFLVESPMHTSEFSFYDGKLGSDIVSLITLDSKIDTGRIVVLMNGTEYFNKSLKDVNFQTIEYEQNRSRNEYSVSLDDLNPHVDVGTYLLELAFINENHNLRDISNVNICKCNVFKDNTTNVSIIIYNSNLYLKNGHDDIIQIVTPEIIDGNVVVYIDGDNEYFNCSLDDFDYMDAYDDFVIYSIKQHYFDSLNSGMHDINVTFSNENGMISNNDTIVLSPLVDVNIDSSDILYDDDINYFAYLEVLSYWDIGGKIVVFINGTEFFNKDIYDFDEDYISEINGNPCYFITPFYLDNFVTPGTYDVDVVYYDNGGDEIVNESATITFVDNYESDDEPSVIDNGDDFDEFNATVKMVETAIAVNVDADRFESGEVSVSKEYVANVVSNLNDTVVANDFTKMFKNETQYLGTFYDSQGNLLKNTQVSLNVNGVSYNRTSDENGVVCLNINLNPGEYNLTAINPSTGEIHTTLITVLPIIVESYNLTKYYRNASQYTLRILGDDGKPVGAGVDVTFNIGGVIYSRTTNESGYVKLNINLIPGEYIVTAEYKGLKTSNIIKVLSILDLSWKYEDKLTFEAKVLDGQGKPYAEQKVSFNIRGSIYYRYTDSNGIALLKINLQAGEYIITSTFNELNVSDKVTVSS